MANLNVNVIKRLFKIKITVKKLSTLLANMKLSPFSIFLFNLSTFILIKREKFSKISLFISLTFKFAIFTHHCNLRTKFYNEMYKQLQSLHDCDFAYLTKRPPFDLDLVLNVLYTESQSRIDFYRRSREATATPKRRGVAARHYYRHLKRCL